MNKREFLEALNIGLSGLPPDDVKERLGFYAEMIDDRIEDGLTEEEAVEEMGSVEQITSQIVSEIPLIKIVKEKVTPQRQLKSWEIVLIVAGSPLWLSLAIAVCAVLFSLLVVKWAVVASLWAVVGALGAGAIGGVVYGVVLLVGGSGTTGLATLSMAFVCAGLAIVAFLGSVQVTKGALQTRKIVAAVKSRVVNGLNTKINTKVGVKNE